MTTKLHTSALSLKDDLNARSSVSERLFQIAYGAIQWPWLVKSLHGGTKADKRRLLLRLNLETDALPHLGSWKADTYFLHRLVDIIEERSPAHVVELGSGASSLVIAKALLDNGGGHLTSYDQHLPFVEQMTQWLVEHQLTASFRHAPLTQRDPRWPGLWYKLPEITPKIDLLVIDGPPWAVHPYCRGMAERLFSHIALGGTVVMDDAARPGERYVTRRWRQDWPDFKFTFEGRGAKGLLVGIRGKK